MSGVELVGLLLGAIALIEPIGKGLKSASGIMKSSASFQEYIISTSLEYHCHSQAFRNESRRIFGALLTEPEMDDLFGDHGDTDPRWQDQAWRDSVKSYLGTFYDGISSSMLLIFRTLSALNEDIARLKDLDELPQPGDQYRNNGPGIHVSEQSIPTKIKSRLEIKKKDIKKYFDDLMRYNLLYQSSVNHFLEDQKWSARATTAIMKADNRRSRLTKSSGAAPWNTVSQVIDNLHEATKMLSFALQKVASCSCHTFHLRLEMVSLTGSNIPLGGQTTCFMNRDPRYQTINFNLITLGCSSPQQSGNCHQMFMDSARMGKPSNRLSLRVEVKPYTAPRLNLARPVSASPILKRSGNYPLHMETTPSILGAGVGTTNIQTTTTISSISSSSKSKLKKTVAFAHNSLMTVVASSEKRKRKEVGVLENPRLKPELTSEVDQDIQLAAETPVIPQEISDLCAWLRSLGFSDPRNTPKGKCGPGILKGDGDVQYLIYEEEDNETPLHNQHNQGDYGSLLEYLSSGQNSLSISQRLELSHTLAISLLRLHSSSWIQRNWSSKDVMLFLPPDATEAERRWSPYVAAAFNDLREIQEIAQAEHQDEPGYKLSYVVSLGIIFLEIGLSRSLRAEQEGTLTGDPHFDAYLQACGEVKIHSVNMSMGPVYDRVVETCIKWMDADELDDKVVQQKFYEEVVLGLEKCIQVANCSQERRRQRRSREIAKVGPLTPEINPSAHPCGPSTRQPSAEL
ncbi:hypothetical protein TWF481_007725 [Arthrobotrys musiformis]|uniref:DUF7580 domain-containing protein n=1 Tax=Arthrobotrys musiformis TaxID=47236 RepID=A0AAV9WCB6_9PEZI